MTSEELIKELESHFTGYTCVIKTEDSIKELASLKIKTVEYIDNLGNIKKDKVIILEEDKRI